MSKIHCIFPLYLLTLLSFASSQSNSQNSENFAQTASVSVGRHLLGRIASLVSNWYSYTYDGTPQDIADGGNDMYDSGNRVFFSRNTEGENHIIYNESSSAGPSDYSSFASHPFLFLAWIRNARFENSSRYMIRVSSNTGADGAGNIDVFNGTVNRDTFSTNYQVFQVSGTSDPSICEVYFNFQSSKLSWSSILENPLNVVQFATSTGYPDNEVELIGNTNRVLMGYTLLSKHANGQGIPVTRDEIEDVLFEMMNVLNMLDPPVDSARGLTTIPVTVPQVIIEAGTTSIEETTFGVFEPTVAEEPEEPDLGSSRIVTKLPDTTTSSHISVTCVVSKILFLFSILFYLFAVLL